MRLQHLTALSLCMVLLVSAGGLSRERVRIPKGTFQPMYGTDSPNQMVEVQSFRIDSLPVLNKEFRQFIALHPEWSKRKISPLFADTGYLASWNRASVPSESLTEIESAPVTNVSWFAAQAFCQFHGGRLPSTFEWEFVASASDLKANASRDPEFVEELLGWYSRPSGADLPNNVRHAKRNFYGVRALHGYVWEWVADFNSIFVTGDNRKDEELNKNLFCGAGSETASDKANYAAFMRYALRSSLKGTYTLTNLGFRCAYDN